MGSYTSKFQLYKPDGSEFVDVGRDLNANWDKIAATGPNGAPERVELIALDAKIDNLHVMVFGSTSRTQMPSCRIQKTGTQNVADNTPVAVNFGSKVWESEPSMSDPANDQIIVPIAGIYVIVFSYTFEGNFSGVMRGRVEIDGSVRAGTRTTGTGSGTGFGDSPDQVVHIGNMTTGGRITASVWQNSGSLQKLTNVGIGTTLTAVYVGKTG